jgi:hypothetical protein
VKHSPSATDLHARANDLHPANQVANLFAGLGLPRPPGPRPQPPKQTESGPMPGHDGFRFHTDQGLGPTRAQLAEHKHKVSECERMR